MRVDAMFWGTVVLRQLACDGLLFLSMFVEVLYNSWAVLLFRSRSPIIVRFPTDTAPELLRLPLLIPPVRRLSYRLNGLWGSVSPPRPAMSFCFYLLNYSQNNIYSEEENFLLFFKRTLTSLCMVKARTVQYINTHTHTQSTIYDVTQHWWRYETHCSAFGLALTE